MPKSHVEFWQKKFDNNVRRDGVVKAELLERGIKHLTVWECAIRRMQRDKVEEERALAKIILFVKSNEKKAEIM